MSFSMETSEASNKFLPLSNMAAPNNDHWTQKAEVPSGDEIMGLDNTQDEIVLPSNRPLGPWTSVVEYLGTHYQLFREEAIAPLRDAVAYLRESPGMKDSKTVSIYDKGHLVRVTAATRGLAFRIRFSTERAGKKIIWPHSSRLVPGSLVALSPANDMFSTKCMVATVASRALENVTKYPPEIDIYFACPDDIDIDSQQEWVMVEAKEGYFEASRYTLTALQKMVKEKFPLSQFICGLDTNVAVAENAKMKQFMNFQHLTGVAAKEKDVHSILDLPDTPMGSLNILQWQAMKEILTKKITLIQGPPGTGKTHVSVAALQVLLQSMVKGDPPIIIAAHTNHAVDQLLKLVSTSEPNYIRLGGRTTDLQIVEKTLYNIKRSRPLPRFNYSFRDLKKETYNLASLILAVFKPLQPEINGNIISASTFLDYGVLTTEQVESLKFEVDLLMGWNDHKESEPLACWIDEHAPKTLVDYGEECTSFLEDDMDRMDEAKQGYDAEDRDTLSGKSAAFDAMFSQRDNDSVTEDTIRAHLQGPDLCQIPSKLRGPTYKYLRGKLIQILNENVRDLAKRYNEACKSFAVARLEGDCEILRSAKLIAMTTTGLSKYRDLVASLKPRIVMIEEAAEVLEGPVTAACMESVEQLILVGDHKQLRGHCALPDLTGPPFHLDLSMFERLIGNNMPYIMLREQRRMVPEIRELLHPIYGELHDHRSVREYPPIPGMGNTRTFFFTHRWPEQGDSFSSKLNEMEGAMVVELCVWLILNGTPGNKITILTFYNGQRTTIFKLMRRHKHSLLLKSTNIVTVDSYQGEENEIILASLVRSNSNQSIGFLGVDNRVCVALSRAKRGFFLFGNAEVLASSSPLWKQVLSIMMADLNNLRVGRTFPLTCKSHGRPIYISALGDWKNTADGCQRCCGGKLKCGHLCQILCHAYSHQSVICNEQCSYVFPCCKQACKQACKESHDHQCNCSSQPRPAPAKKSELKEDEASRIQRLVEDLEKAAIAGEFSRRPPPRHGPGNKRNIPAKQGLGGPQYPRRNGGRKNFFREQTLPSPSNNAQIADNRQKWQEFANGGAKVMDDHMNTLARATDPNSEAVKHAVSSLEKSLLPRNYWPLKESLELEKQGVLEGLPKTEEQLKPQQPSESQQSETPTKPEVPQGNLIDLD